MYEQYYMHFMHEQTNFKCSRSKFIDKNIFNTIFITNKLLIQSRILKNQKIINIYMYQYI